MYKKVDASLNFLKREQEVLDFWNENDVFERSIKNNEGHSEFTFYDGPPTANGKPHIGHVLTRVMKDIIPRYQTMKGKHVLRKAGWDTHGLPVELEIEKKLGLDGKQDIEKYGIEPFIKECKQSVWKYTDEWKKMSDRLGYWVDMEHPYVTYHDDYIESVWWALKTISEKGLLYKGHKIVPYCPRCGTALSSHEVAQGYKDVKEKSVYVKFKIKGRDNAYFLVWTTTPWTLPSNVALCMNAGFDYVEIKVGDEIYVLAEALVPSLFEDYEVVSKKKGKDYEHVEYEPMFPYALGTFRQKAFYVTNDDYVTLTDGTGIVHIAPAFGEDDANVGRKYDLPFVQMVNDRGRFVDAVEPYKGMFVKDTDKLIIKDLKESGKLFKDVLFEHSYPFCWRCNTPLLYYARSSWFIKTTAIKEQLIASNKTVNWMPETIGTGRMGNFLENVIDWGLSRERYWGTPLPIWVCEDCGEIHVMGSKKELKEMCGIEGDIELHRPYIDAPTCKCGKCGGKMKRVKEVIDCWFDSGSMPFAQFHYPFENKDLFEKHFPADFISEAVDQTRGWFYTLLTISTLLFGKSPFKNCIVLGHVNDKNGIKMSKHIGNVVDPWSVLDKQGADAVRWYFYTGSAPWLPSRFSAEAVSEGQRKFMGTLWNTYAFFVLYADIDKYDPSKYDVKKCKLSLMDKWALSKLNTLVKTVDEGLAEYKTFETARYIQDYVDELSNWYIRVNRRRFWKSDDEEDKLNAYYTLYFALKTICQVMSPIIPFLCEYIWQNMTRSLESRAKESIFLERFPMPNQKFDNQKLIADTNVIRNVIAIAQRLRNENQIKIKQPLKHLYVLMHNANVGALKEYDNLIKEELNIKEITFEEDNTKFNDEFLTVNFKTAGARLKGAVQQLKNTLSALSQDEQNSLIQAFKAGDDVQVEGFEPLPADTFILSSKPKKDYVIASENGITCVLDITIDESLMLEGVQRELVRAMQVVRKENDLKIEQRITLFVESKSELINRVVEKFKNKIMQEVLANKFEDIQNPKIEQDLVVADENLVVKIDF